MTDSDKPSALRARWNKGHCNVRSLVIEGLPGFERVAGLALYGYDTTPGSALDYCFVWVHEDGSLVVAEAYKKNLDDLDPEDIHLHLPKDLWRHAALAYTDQTASDPDAYRYAVLDARRPTSTEGHEA